jgi:hypothetical protein
VLLWGGQGRATRREGVHETGRGRRRGGRGALARWLCKLG